jgi:hypothetical protein
VPRVHHRSDDGGGAKADRLGVARPDRPKPRARCLLYALRTAAVAYPVGAAERDGRLLQSRVPCDRGVVRQAPDRCEPGRCQGPHAGE